MKSVALKRNVNWRQKRNNFAPYKKTIYFSAPGQPEATELWNLKVVWVLEGCRWGHFYCTVHGPRVAKKSVRVSNLFPVLGGPPWADISLIIITFICNWTLTHLVVWATEGRHRLESYVCNWRYLRLVWICGEIKNKMKLIWKMRGLELAVSWLVTHGTCRRWPRQKSETWAADRAMLPARLWGACHNL